MQTATVPNASMMTDVTPYGGMMADVTLDAGMMTDATTHRDTDTATRPVSNGRGFY